MNSETTGATITQPSPFTTALACFLAAREALENLPQPITGRDEDIATAAWHAAERELFDTPAGDVADLRTKFEVCWPDPYSLPPDRYLLAMFADLRLLTADAPSRIFRAGKWLKWFEQKGGMYCVRDGEVFLLTPAGKDLSDCLFELEAMSGREAVNSLIRKLAKGEETDHG